MDLKWPEMARNAIQSDFQTSKMAAEKKILIRSEMYRSEMARIVIESEFRTSKMADVSHFVKNFKNNLRIDLKWPEMRLKVKYGHPKWPMSAILSKISKKIKVAYRCEMDINEIENDFRTSKMAAGSHFVKKNSKNLKLHIDLKWPEMRSKVKFGHPKWPTSAIVKNFKKK